MVAPQVETKQCEGKTPAKVVIYNVVPYPLQDKQPSVTLRNQGGQAANIQGWRLTDSDTRKVNALSFGITRVGSLVHCISLAPQLQAVLLLPNRALLPHCPRCALLNRASDVYIIIHLRCRLMLPRITSLAPKAARGLATSQSRPATA